MSTLKNLCLSSWRRQKESISLGTEINFALLQMLSSTPSEHTSCSPKMAKLGNSVKYFVRSAFNLDCKSSTVDLSSFLTATHLFFLGGAFPTCRDSLLLSEKAEGLHTMQHKEVCSTVPPSDLIIDDRKQFSLSVQKDFSAGSLIFSASDVKSKWALDWNPTRPALPHNYVVYQFKRKFTLEHSGIPDTTGTWYQEHHTQQPPPHQVCPCPTFMSLTQDKYGL